MASSRKRGQLQFSGPATYRIVVQGSLPPEWSERLAGMAIANSEEDEHGMRATLFGAIRDQAELAGVLDTLHELHLSIIRVEEIEDSV